MFSRQITTMGSDAPKFLVRMTFESNTAFFVAIFVLICGIAWGLRDHRRRQLELATEEQEDRLYMAVLAGMFLICTIGAYQVFRKQKLMREYEGQGHLVPIDKLIDKKVEEIMDNVMHRKAGSIIWVEDDDEDFRYFLMGLGLTTIALLLSWMITRSGYVPKETQQPSAQGEAGEAQPTQSAR